MVIAMVCLIVINLIGFIGWAWFLRVLVERKQQQLEQAIRAFVSSPDENTPSPLAAVTDQVAAVFAARLMQQLLARMNGALGGSAKSENAAAVDAIEGQLIASGPSWLPIVMGILPKKYTRAMLKNPQMMQGLASMMAGKNGGDQSGSADAQEINRRMMS